MKRCILHRFVVLCLLLAGHKTLAQSAPQTDALYEKAIATGRADSMYFYARKIDSLSSGTNFPYGKVQAKILAAYYFYAKLQLDTALSLLKSSEEFFEDNLKHAGSREHGRVFYYQSMVHLRRSQYTESKLSAVRALEIFRALNDSYYEANTLLSLGKIEFFRNNRPKALEYFQKAYETKFRTGRKPDDYIDEINMISMVYRMMGQFEPSMAYARLALKHYKNADDSVGMMYALNNLGLTSSSMQRWDSAMYFYQRSQSIASAQENTNMHLAVVQNIANLHFQKGDYKTSIALLEASMRQYPRLATSPGGNAPFLKAKNLYELGQYDSCIRIAERVFKSLDKAVYKDQLVGVTELLSKAYERRGGFKEALEYSNLRHAYKDSIYNKENQSQLATLYAEIENIEKQREIALLEQKNELDRAENRILYITLGLGALSAILIVVALILRHRNREKKQLLINYQLQDELEQKKRDLHQQALRMIHFNNYLAEVQSGLKKIKADGPGGHQDIQHVLSTIQINKALEKEWENFDRYFGNVHTGFYEKVSNAFPNLTIPEKRLAGLIKMNLTNSEIASVLNIESNSVKTAKYRLKKKLELDEEQDIATFLHNF